MTAVIADWLDAAAERRPDRPALIGDAGPIDYAALAERTHRVAAWMAGVGVARGDRVLVLLPTCVELVESVLGCARLGACFVVISPAIKPYQLAHVLADCEPSLVVTHSTRADLDLLGQGRRVLLADREWPEVLATAPAPAPSPPISNDLACLVYTSGSTAMPKGVMTAHRHLVFAAGAIQQRLRIRPDDVIGHFLPMSFDYGLYQLFLAIQAGAALALGTDDHTGYALLRKISDWGVTGLPVVPALAANLVRLARRSGERLPSLRFITNTGAHLPSGLVADLRALWPDCSVFPMFGLTECKRVSILLPEEYDRKPESVGRPLPDTECLIVDEAGRPLPAGAQGELVVRGQHVMAGYWRAPELTDGRFRPWGPQRERVLFTGDRCSLDADGYLYFHGRLDDVFKQRGYRVSALEVEAAAMTLPGVREAALIVATVDGDARSILACVGEAAADAVGDGLRGLLEEYKQPDRVVRCEEL
ncbi:MAG TPA: AMP-binding protein, partial [Candidatus Dormibacteraeota bacterium]|nr:AMP-binding protein [Candidatus Dormibacteraeota bacterium]